MPVIDRDKVLTRMVNGQPVACRMKHLEPGDECCIRLPNGQHFDFKVAQQIKTSPEAAAMILAEQRLKPTRSRPE